MVKVVTIDFDIIMSPCIEFYNDLIGVEDPLKDFVKDFSFLTNLPADLYQYEHLTRYIIRSLKNVCQIHFITSHEKIVPILESLPHDEPVEVVNIDHHHDVGYDIKFDKPIISSSCGNWVKYCRDRKFLDSYCWIKNDNSNDIESRVYREKYIDQEILFKDAQLEQLAKETDILVICASYEWIPPIYHPLILNWQTICEEVIGQEYPFDSF